MGTGRTFVRPTSSRLRVIAVGTLIILFLLYTTSPHSLGSDSSFQPTPQYGQQDSKWPFGFGHKPRQRTVQFPFAAFGKPAGDKTRAKAVRETMRDTFWKYKGTAWGADEVQPISGGGKTTRNGWAATIVDTLTTTALMGLTEEFEIELNFTINNIKWTRASGLVDPFETTIRYLGALVSTVDLIDTKTVTATPEQRDAVLEQAVALAGKLGPGFDSPTGMIWPRVNFASNEGCREVESERPYPHLEHATIGPARAGSNWLENKSLSRLTKDPVYEVNATKAWTPLVWNPYIEEWPGLVDGPIDIMTGEPIDRHRSWGAGHDSYYEYLIKAHIMAPNDPHSAKYGERWIQAVESTMKELAWKAYFPDSHPERTGKTFIAQWRNGWLLNEMGHLACFMGGNIILGGRYLEREDFVQFGLDVTDTCHETYVKSKSKIGPEHFSFYPYGHASTFEPQHEGHWEQVRKSGFWVTDARWHLRPETVESYFYAYRITGNKMYQDWAWDAYTAFIEASTAKYGYAEVQDVTAAPGPDNQRDQSESFWGAETLKYLYLTFASENVGSLDEWVYSTEAHPFRIMK